MSAVPRERARKGDGAATRAQLLDAALAEFARQGYAGATIRSITRAVGVRESAFYVYFASKQAAYDELFAEAGPDAVLRAAANAAHSDDPAEAIRSIASAIMDAWVAPRAQAFASVFVRDAFVGDALGERMLLISIERAVAALAIHFDAWMRAGRIRVGVTAEHLAWELLAPLNVVRFLHFNAASTHDDRQRGEDLVEQHIAYFILRNVQTVP